MNRASRVLVGIVVAMSWVIPGCGSGSPEPVESGPDGGSPTPVDAEGTFLFAGLGLDEDRPGIYLAGRDGRETRLLHELPRGHYPAFRDLQSMRGDKNVGIDRIGDSHRFAILVSTYQVSTPHILQILDSTTGEAITREIDGLGPIYSATGNYLAYKSQGGVSRLLVGPTDESPATEIADGVGSPRWSPTGERLIFWDHSPGELVLYDAATDELLTIGSGEMEGSVKALWSPDGARMLYTVSDANGWSVELGDGRGEAREILDSGEEWPTIYPGWSPDGSYFVTLIKGTLTVYAPNGEILSTLDLYSELDASSSSLSGWACGNQLIIEHQLEGVSGSALYSPADGFAKLTETPSQMMLRGPDKLGFIGYPPDHDFYLTDCRGQGREDVASNVYIESFSSNGAVVVYESRDDGVTHLVSLSDLTTLYTMSDPVAIRDIPGTDDLIVYGREVPTWFVEGTSAWGLVNPDIPLWPNIRGTARVE